MTKKELILASEMLKIASQVFANHGCNDVDDAVYANWTSEQRQELCKKFWEWNGTPEEYNPNSLDLGDNSLMAYLSDKLLEMANESK